LRTKEHPPKKRTLEETLHWSFWINSTSIKLQQNVFVKMQIKEISYFYSIAVYRQRPTTSCK